MSDPTDAELLLVPRSPAVRAFTDEQFDRLIAVLSPDPAAALAARDELVKALYIRIAALESQLRRTGR